MKFKKRILFEKMAGETLGTVTLDRKTITVVANQNNTFIRNNYANQHAMLMLVIMASNVAIASDFDKDAIEKIMERSGKDIAEVIKQ